METEKKVIEILKTTKTSGIDYNTLKNDTSLGDQGLDSLGKMELFFNIEEEFGIEISDKEMDGIQTINQLTELINSKLK